jgi:hypothetical protein
MPIKDGNVSKSAGAPSICVVSFILFTKLRPIRSSALANLHIRGFADISSELLAKFSYVVHVDGRLMARA